MPCIFSNKALVNKTYSRTDWQKPTQIIVCKVPMNHLLLYIHTVRFHHAVMLVCSTCVVIYQPSPVHN
jgi:hypothetical protein